MVVTDFPRRGRFYWVRIPAESANKRRPALVISVDARNRLASDVMVVPVSTVVRGAPTHVRLRRRQGGLPRTSILKCEQLTTLPKNALERKPLGGPLSETVLIQVEKAILRSIGVPVD